MRASTGTGEGVAPLPVRTRLHAGTPTNLGAMGTSAGVRGMIAVTGAALRVVMTVLACGAAVLGLRGLHPGQREHPGRQGGGEGEERLTPRGCPTQRPGETVESLPVHRTPPNVPRLLRLA